jgi:hypothetical protein
LTCWLGRPDVTCRRDRCPEMPALLCTSQKSRRCSRAACAPSWQFGCSLQDILKNRNTATDLLYNSELFLPPLGNGPVCIVFYTGTLFWQHSLFNKNIYGVFLLVPARQRGACIYQNLWRCLMGDPSAAALALPPIIYPLRINFDSLITGAGGSSVKTQLVINSRLFGGRGLVRGSPASRNFACKKKLFMLYTVRNAFFLSLPTILI